ncbi:MAG TPA: outer membrane protein assembly factor BamA [Blastocatellia bacterium]|nr:outer membrane protein assembly factor BamA [Blastocatellia bacterium]
MFGYGRIVSIALFCTVMILLVTDSSIAQDQSNEVKVEDIETRGSRRIPKETILYTVQTKPGDVYRESAIRQDFEAILNLGFFDPLTAKIYKVNGPRGGIIVVYEVQEYPIIRDLKYQDLKAATESEVLTRFKEKNVGITKDSYYDPVKAFAATRVLQGLLAEKGYPEADVKIEIEDISATAIALNFVVEQGPRVRVKEIDFIGADAKFSDARLKRAMKLVKEAGLIATFTSKDIYSKDKLEYDLEMVRQFLGSKGYIQAKIGTPVVEPNGTVSNHMPIPMLRKKGPGLKIVVPIEVGRRYRISRVEEKGVTLFQPGIVSTVSGLKVGDIASTTTIRKGVYENIKNAYGNRGYIEATADLEPNFIDKNDDEGDVEFTIQVDEGKQFTMRRLEFIGNTNTRDQVLRREVVLNEGDPYSKSYWDLSILRLNQLGLFEEIKEKDAITRTNPRDQTVDIDVQVKERGRQSIQLNGGVSGYAGSFFGIGYSTNNLLGYGQTLSFDFSGGNRQIYLSAGYSDPYFLGKPVSLGVQLFAQRQQYFGNSYNTFSNFYSTLDLSRVNLDSLFTQEVAGGTISLSSPLSILTRRFQRYGNFTRIGLSYTLTASRIKDPKVNRDNDTSNDVPVSYSQPRIVTSRITPSLSFNTLNSSIDPTRGQSLFMGLSFGGGVLGGDVNTISPSLEYKYFRPVFKSEAENPHVFGMRFLAGHVRSYGTPLTTQSLAFVGGVPITERFFLGGENDVRGYNFYSISPVAQFDYFRSSRNVTAHVKDSGGNLVDVTDGSVHPSVLRAFTFDAPEGACGETKTATCNVERIVREDANGKEIPFYTAIGGDTRVLFNFEYRIPITSRFSIANFFDIGAVFNTRRYIDQVVTSNYTKQDLTPSGVILNSSGLIASRDELDNAAGGGNGIPPGFRQIYLQGEARSYNLLRLSRNANSLLENTRASLGVEFRVQVPMLNVPFRLIFAYNPNANPDITDPRVLGLEKRTVMRFSIGRTF